MILIFRLYSILLGVSALQPISHRRHFFATTVSGQEKILQSEIAKLTDVSNVCGGKCSISFEGTLQTGLEALLWLRSSLKVMELMTSHERIDGKLSLSTWLKSVKWDEFMNNKQTLKCDTVLGQNVPSELNHNHFTSLTLKNSVVDHFREATCERPSVNTENPDVPLLLYLHRGGGKLYRVWSGDVSMHKRGYRSDVIHKAGLRETTAAALLQLTNWNKFRFRAINGTEHKFPSVLCDPMCGSGTIAVEAALIAADTAPGLMRYAPNPSLTPSRKVSQLPVPLRWIDLLSEGIEPTWQQVLSQTQRRDQRASLRKLKVDPFVYANDIHSGAVELARQAARRAGVEHLIDFRCQDAEVYRPRHPPGIIVSNPPWDQRLHGAKESWHKLAAFVSSQSSATPCSHTSSGNGEAPNSDSSGGNSNEECSVAPKEVHYGVSPAQRRSRKLDLWVLSGNEQLNARYLQQAPHKRIELRTASNNFLIF